VHDPRKIHRHTTLAWHVAADDQRPTSIQTDSKHKAETLQSCVHQQSRRKSQEDAGVLGGGFGGDTGVRSRVYPALPTGPPQTKPHPGSDGRPVEILITSERVPRKWEGSHKVDELGHRTLATTALTRIACHVPPSAPGYGF